MTDRNHCRMRRSSRRTSRSRKTNCCHKMKYLDSRTPSFGQITKLLSPALIVLVVGLSSGCSQGGAGSSGPEATTAQPSAPSAPLTGFERDLQFIRNGEFSYVWVFSRKDGKPLDKDDGAYLRSNAPQVVDWVTTDEGK